MPKYCEARRRNPASQEPKCQRQAADTRRQTAATMLIMISVWQIARGVNLCPRRSYWLGRRRYREIERTAESVAFFALRQNNKRSEQMEPRARFSDADARVFLFLATQQFQLCPLLFASRAAGRAREHSGVAQAEALFALLLRINATHGDEAHVMGNSKVATDSYPKMRDDKLPAFLRPRNTKISFSFAFTPAHLKTGELVFW